MQFSELTLTFMKGFVKTTGGLVALGLGFQLYMMWTQNINYTKKDEKEKTEVLDDSDHEFEIEEVIEDSDKYKKLFG
jgi:hypothetical protein